MKIDLTYKCSMGCNHCMSACDKNGQEMSLETLNDVCNFIHDRKIDTISPVILAITGGEIFEHSQIIECLDMIFNRFGSRTNIGFTLSTNGRILSETPEYLDYLKTMMRKYKRILIQVTDDERFYPTKLDQKQRYHLEKIGSVIDSVPGSKGDRNKCLYPQGRALQNFDERYWYTRAPKCVNCRLLTQQGVRTFKDLVRMMTEAGKQCTPTISPLGEIKLGESRLCPPVASIYDLDKDIFNKILNFKCNSCKESLNIFRQSDPVLSSILYQEK